MQGKAGGKGVSCELASSWAAISKHGLILDEESVKFLESNVNGLTELERGCLPGLSPAALPSKLRLSAGTKKKGKGNAPS
jgi:hypothetical protein